MGSDQDGAFYTEGRVRVRTSDRAFLNPESKASRDISVAFVGAVAKDGKTLDATAATGIRGMRYAIEAGRRDVTFLEINEGAYGELVRNLELNGLDPGSARNTSLQEFTNARNGRFSVIDLDPFGGVTPYIYDIMKIVGDGTLLMATATDTAVLCGAESRACLRLYDAVPMHNELCHEAGLRILAGYIARVAAQFDFGIAVRLALAHRHYMRVFLEMRHGVDAVDESIASMGFAMYCDRCAAPTHEKAALPVASMCPRCGSRLRSAGKMWLGSLYDKSAIGKAMALLDDREAGARTVRMLSTISGELDTPFYYSLAAMTARLHVGSVPIRAVLDALGDMGYNATRTHLDPNGIKTDAPVDALTGCVRDASARIAGKK